MPLPKPLDVARANAQQDPLPLTLWFVCLVGGFILIGWFAMFFLLQARW